MHRQKVVLFDLGGVLIGVTGRIALRALLPHLSDHDVLERWVGSPAVDRFERGQMDATQFADEFIEEWQLQLSRAEFIDSFGNWITGFFDGAQAMVQTLRTEHRVACLSNTNAIHWARLTDAQDLFDVCFASHLTGFMKPEPEAYLHAMRELRVEASDVYFIDDLAVNVAAARDVGINAFRAEGLAEVQAVLRAQGLYAQQA